MTLAFPMVGRFLAWKDGNDTQVRIGTNAIALCGVNIFLHETLVVSFQELGICTLNKIGDDTDTTICKQG
jgi:hypothetical protein